MGIKNSIITFGKIFTTRFLRCIINHLFCIDSDKLKGGQERDNEKTTDNFYCLLFDSYSANVL